MPSLSEQPQRRWSLWTTAQRLVGNHPRAAGQLRRRPSRRPLEAEALEGRLLLADGMLDSAFDTDGRVTIGFDAPGAPSDDQAMAMAIQPADGKIVLAGRANGSGGADFAVARLNANGTLDPSFNNGNGRVTIDFNGRDRAFAVAVFLAP